MRHKIGGDFKYRGRGLRRVAMEMHIQSELAQNLTIRVSKNLYDKVKAREEVNWSVVLRTCLNDFIEGRLVLITTPSGPRLATAEKRTP